jgi:hypothetical protein
MYMYYGSNSKVSIDLKLELPHRIEQFANEPINGSNDWESLTCTCHNSENKYDLAVGLKLGSSAQQHTQKLVYMH